VCAEQGEPGGNGRVRPFAPRAALRAARPATPCRAAKRYVCVVRCPAVCVWARTPARRVPGCTVVRRTEVPPRAGSDHCEKRPLRGAPCASTRRRAAGACSG
jgi:hypothetical protein